MRECGDRRSLWRWRPENITFNHGVEGSSPSALTNENKYLAQSPRSSKTPPVCTASAKQLRRAGGRHDPDTIGLIVTLVALAVLFVATKWQRHVRMPRHDSGNAAGAPARGGCHVPVGAGKFELLMISPR
jgi:hypothetical protein